jgi:hypothetical protein
VPRPRLIVDYGLLAYIGAIADVSSHDCAGTVVALGLEREFELTLPDRAARVRAAVVPPGMVTDSRIGHSRRASGKARASCVPTAPLRVARSKLRARDQLMPWRVVNDACRHIYGDRDRSGSRNGR